MTESQNPLRAHYRLSDTGVTRAVPDDLLDTASPPPLDRPESVVRVELPEEVLDRLVSSTGTNS